MQKSEVSGGERRQGAHSHLWAAVVAMLTVMACCAGLEAFVRWRLPRSLPAFAGIMPPVKLSGNVLPMAALARRDFLVVYGSSELDHDAENRPDRFFAGQPTGFAAFPIGKAGCTCLVTLQKLAALGEALRGKKVVVILSPTWFLRDADPEAVAANLRPAQLGAWVFGNRLSGGLKREIAGRLARYPAAQETDPLLGNTLRNLAGDSRWDQAQMALLRPLGWLENFLRQRAETWAIWRDLPASGMSRRQRQQAARREELTPPSGPPDWERLEAEAEAFDRARGDASPYSVGVPEREERLVGGVKGSETAEAKGVRPAGERDAEFTARLQGSSEWTDLRLLLRVLRELGAEALVISQPFNGQYRDAGGETAKARRAYYERLDKCGQEAGFAVRGFAEHEQDRTFFNDAGHPSAKAWVFYDQALDEFFHAR